MGKSVLCSTSEVAKQGLRCLRPSISPNSSRSSLYTVLSPCTYRSATPIFFTPTPETTFSSIKPHLVVLYFAPASSNVSIGLSLAGQSSTSIPQKASSLGTDHHKCTIWMVQLLCHSVTRIPLDRNKNWVPDYGRVHLYNFSRVFYEGNNKCTLNAHAAVLRMRSKLTATFQVGEQIFVAITVKRHLDKIAKNGYIHGVKTARLDLDANNHADSTPLSSTWFNFPVVCRWSYPRHFQTCL
ncbi:hypothetical protein GQ600_18845 [Phytophthora cactorum]|nr:hypothetical protein GQ600_18845 [Phytophthora cactorum]